MVVRIIYLVEAQCNTYDIKCFISTLITSEVFNIFLKYLTATKNFNLFEKRVDTISKVSTCSTFLTKMTLLEKR